MIGRIIGIFLVSVPFILTFIASVIELGLQAAISAWFVTIVIMALLFGGVWLIMDSFE